MNLPPFSACCLLFSLFCTVGAVSGCGGGDGSDLAQVPAADANAGSGAAPVLDDLPQNANTLLPGWSLAWSDEFNTDGLPDTSKWDYDTERNPVGWYNNELQYYARARTENTRIENGRLIISARKEILRSVSDYGGQAYTSARLITRGKVTWTYGFVEVRAKTPCSRGTWPAIWMLGSGGRWPEDGEIDILEQRGSEKTRVLGTVHTRAYNYFNGSLGVGRGASTTVASACTDFNRYQLTWTPDRIQIGVNGNIYMTYDNPKNGDAAQWPFDKPQYLILNVAMGGDLGGAVDANFSSDQMEVDYVRVYRK